MDETICEEPYSIFPKSFSLLTTIKHLNCFLPEEDSSNIERVAEIQTSKSKTIMNFYNGKCKYGNFKCLTPLADQQLRGSQQSPKRLSRSVSFRKNR